jgi:ABC-type nitrate/sulfonate/bicarbonate transport system ATPase subunit
MVLTPAAIGLEDEGRPAFGRATGVMASPSSSGMGFLFLPVAHEGNQMAQQVSIRRVSKRFRQNNLAERDLAVLHEVDLSIAPGEFVAILGPSGCGKSTLLRMIAGLEQPTAGTLQIGDRVVDKADPRCAIVFQEPRLFPWKRVSANVSVGARRLHAPASPDAWLERVGLTDFADCYPHQLSGGMAQRVALARALIGRPEVLLLDEPFAALDALTRLQMQDLLADVCANLGATAVMVTHDADEALHLADRVFVMSHRPAVIVETVRVDLPRPRRRGDPAIAELRSQILRHFGFDHGGTLRTASHTAVAAD